MGRQSAASLSIVPVSQIDGRPRAPDELTQGQREIWERTVANEAADVFRTAALQQILKEYCRHVETAARLSAQVDRATDVGSNMPMDELEKLLRCRDRETKALSDKATKLRLTNQSRYTPQAAGTAAKKASSERKPWQIAG